MRRVSRLTERRFSDPPSPTQPFGGKELGVGVGVVNPRSDTVESRQGIRAVVEEALRFCTPNQIFLNPDCGFGTFSNRPLNMWETAAAKVGAMVATAHELRGRRCRVRQRPQALLEPALWTAFLQTPRRRLE